MGLKKRPILKEKRSSLLIGKKPSPKKMSPAKIPPSASRRREKTPDSHSKPSTSGDTPRSAFTPMVDRPSLVTPRSNERYELRSITHPSYSLKSRRRISSSLLKTPRGIANGTPSRIIGKTQIRTPFRTPKIKLIGRQPPQNTQQLFRKHKDEALIWKADLRAMTSKTYKLCNLSTMSNFKYQNSRLRRKYETHLRNKILEVFPAPLLTVALSLSSCLTLQPDAMDAIRIEVTSLNVGENEAEDEMISVYNAWLFRTTSVQSIPLENSDWFPVMLYHGKELLHHAVLDWLQGSFGCYISRYGIRQSDLLWIAGVWSGHKCALKSHSSSSDNKIHLAYLFHALEGMALHPSQPRGQSRMKFSIAQTDIHHIWENIIDVSRQRVMEEELIEFFTTLNSLVHKFTAMPAYLLSLHQLKTPCMKLSADGTVRVSCTHSVRVMVKHLIDIFVQSLSFHSDESEMEETIEHQIMGDSE
ncbi:hypothetical protein SK128_023309 [Halocaridina rubra]|uniref:Centromere protein L n=1 Tax=Halocaridina rubra TaxID=373956 RepID=A0AAN8X6A2_HALRR